jgi:hypothetical protein
MMPNLTLEGGGEIDKECPRADIDGFWRLFIGNEARQSFQQCERRHMLVMQFLTDPI